MLPGPLPTSLTPPSPLCASPFSAAGLLPETSLTASHSVWVSLFHLPHSLNGCSLVCLPFPHLAEPAYLLYRKEGGSECAR